MVQSCTRDDLDHKLTQLLFRASMWLEDTRQASGPNLQLLVWPQYRCRSDHGAVVTFLVEPYIPPCVAGLRSCTRTLGLYGSAASNRVS